MACASCTHAHASFVARLHVLLRDAQSLQLGVEGVRGLILPKASVGGRRSAARADETFQPAGLVQKLDDPAPGMHVGKRHRRVSFTARGAQLLRLIFGARCACWTVLVEVGEEMNSVKPLATTAIGKVSLHA